MSLNTEQTVLVATITVDCIDPKIREALTAVVTSTARALLSANATKGVQLQEGLPEELVAGDEDAIEDRLEELASENYIVRITHDATTYADAQYLEMPPLDMID